MTKRAVGLIGGIASGKSLASDYFKDLGIIVIDSDQIARAIVAKGMPLLNEVANHFGSEILTAEGHLDRKALREIIFASPDERLWLENLLHPVIREKIESAIDEAPDPYCVVAIPLLKKREDYPKLTKILMIDMPYSLELEYLIARDQISKTLAETIIASQPSREIRLQLADFVIENTGTRAEFREKIKAFDLEIRMHHD